MEEKKNDAPSDNKLSEFTAAAFELFTHLMNNSNVKRFTLEVNKTTKTIWYTFFEGNNKTVGESCFNEGDDEQDYVQSTFSKEERDNVIYSLLDKGFTQQTIARKLGLSQAFISKVKKARSQKLRIWP